MAQRVSAAPLWAYIGESFNGQIYAFCEIMYSAFNANFFIVDLVGALPVCVPQTSGVLGTA